MIAATWRIAMTSTTTPILRDERRGHITLPRKNAAPAPNATTSIKMSVVQSD